jgi:hypothetical protein
VDIADGLGLLALGVSLAQGVATRWRQSPDALGHRPIPAPEDADRVSRRRLRAALLEVELQVLLLEPAGASVRQVLLTLQAAQDPAEAHVPGPKGNQVSSCYPCDTLELVRGIFYSALPFATRNLKEPFDDAFNGIKYLRELLFRYRHLNDLR